MKVGDRVRVVSNVHGNSSNDLIGCEGTVVSIDCEADDDDCYVPAYGVDVELDTWGLCPFDAGELEVIHA